VSIDWCQPTRCGNPDVCWLSRIITSLFAPPARFAPPSPTTAFGSKGGAMNLKVGGRRGGGDWKKGRSNTVKTLIFEKGGGCKPPPPSSSYGGTAPA